MRVRQELCASGARVQRFAGAGSMNMAAVEIKIPDIGDFKDVEVIEVLVKPGDKVTKEQSLITVESDKASMEIPSPAEGTVESLRVKIGDKVSEGKPILVLSGAAPAAETPAAAAPQARATEAPAAPAPRAAAPSPQSSDFAVEMGARPVVSASGVDTAMKPHASPSVRRFARELGVDLAAVRGSGPK